jgi:hypothetical protein
MDISPFVHDVKNQVFDSTLELNQKTLTGTPSEHQIQTTTLYIDTIKSRHGAIKNQVRDFMEKVLYLVWGVILHHFRRDGVSGCCLQLCAPANLSFGMGAG